uniref:Uncharacterized protein n=1 Tax=Rhizophora mucronata TaxID=61149 RepID=A0A2P2QKS6_RHIMU
MHVYQFQHLLFLFVY